MKDVLRSLRIIALEQAVAVPLCTRQLADQGADVIKIERPNTGDFARRYDSSVHGQSAHFVWLNRGKRSVAVNVKSPQGREILRRLFASADVLISNLSPEALARVVDDDSLAREFPTLIRCYVSGYGATGPFRDRKAYDLLIQGEAGVTRSTGLPSAPAKAGVSVADLAGGAYALAAIALALYDRTRTGEGRRIDIALFDVICDWMSPLLLAQKHSGQAPIPAGMHHASICPYGAFPTIDGTLVNLAVQNDEQWRRFCVGVLHRSDLLEQPKYATNELRTQNRRELETIVSSVLARYTTLELEAMLESADVPWGRVNDLSEVINHPQLVERSRWVPLLLPVGDVCEVLEDPLQLGPTDTKKVPAVGEHTEEVLQELGYPSDQIDRLRSAGVIG